MWATSDDAPVRTYPPRLKEGKFAEGRTDLWDVATGKPLATTPLREKLGGALVMSREGAAAFQTAVMRGAVMVRLLP